MSYRGRRRRRSYNSSYDGTDWAHWHRTKRDEVRVRFGGIDEDVTEALFSLSRQDLERVFKLYEKNYGTSAANYARGAISQWRSGQRSMAGQTLERIIEVVPYVLSFKAKKNLFFKVRAAYLEHETVTLTVATVEDIEFVQGTVERIVERAKAQPLPEHVNSKLIWLSEGDGLVARQIIAASEEAEGVAIAQAVRREMAELHRFFWKTLEAGRHDLTHVISLPCGTVTVEFARPKKKRWFFMSEEEEEQPQSNLPARRQDRPAKDIFEFAMQNMINPEDSQEIVLAAQREHLRLAAKEREGEIDSSQASTELSEFIEQMRKADNLQTIDVEGDASFQRASGTTHLTVKKKKRFFFF